MTDDEWTLWQEGIAALSWPQLRLLSPCFDCLPAFAAEMRKVDRCDGRPGLRERVDETPRLRGWHDSNNRKAARKAGYRGSLGVVFARADGVK